MMRFNVRSYGLCWFRGLFNLLKSKGSVIKKDKKEDFYIYLHSLRIQCDWVACFCQFVSRAIQKLLA